MARGGAARAAALAFEMKMSISSRLTFNIEENLLSVKLSEEALLGSNGLYDMVSQCINHQPCGSYHISEVSKSNENAKAPKYLYVTSVCISAVS